MITNITIFSLLMQFASVDGHVRDAQNRNTLPLVRIELLHQGVPSALEYSDAGGQFHFANVVPGSYTISATSLGYDPKSVAFDTDRDSSFEIELTRTADHKQSVSPVVSVRDYMVPETAKKEFDRARKDIQRQDCPKAIAHLENGLRLVDHASALNDLGNCYRKLGDFNSAEASFKRAVELSDSVYIALNLAEVYTAQKRFSDARAVLDRATSRTPGNGDAYYGLALTYFQEERFDEAEAAALQADSRAHKIVDLHLLLAKIYARKNRDKALEQLEIYLKEAPNGPESDRVRQALKTGRRK
jgi:tetratricopeptide (TPR) repeat protein